MRLHFALRCPALLLAALAPAHAQDSLAPGTHIRFVAPVISPHEREGTVIAALPGVMLMRLDGARDTMLIADTDLHHVDRRTGDLAGLLGIVGGVGGVFLGTAIARSSQAPPPRCTSSPGSCLTIGVIGEAATHFPAAFAGGVAGGVVGWAVGALIGSRIPRWSRVTPGIDVSGGQPTLSLSLAF